MWVALLVFASLLGASHAQSCDLSCWLGGLRIAVPFDGHNELFDLSDIVCDQVSLPGLSSSVQPDGAGLPTLSLGLDAFFSCSLHWRAFGLGPGTASFTLASHVTLVAQLLGDGRGLPVGLVVVDEQDSEQVEVHIEPKHFLTKVLLDVLHGLIVDVARKKVHAGFLAGVLEAAEAASEALRDLSAVLGAPVPPLLEPLFAGSVANVTQNRVLHTVRVFARAVGPGGVDFVVRRLANNGTALLGGPGDAITVPAGALGTFSVSLLQTAFLGGFDTLEELDALEPVSSYEVETTLVLQSLATQVDAKSVFSLNTSAGWIREQQPWTTVVSLDLALNATRIALRNLLVLDETLLVNLHGNQFADLGCVAAAVHNDTSFSRIGVEATVGALRVSDRAPLEASLLALLDNIGALFAWQFPTVGARVVAVVADGAVRRSANAALGSMLNRAESNDSCPLYMESRDGLMAPFYPPPFALILAFGCAGALALLMSVVAYAWPRGQRRRKRAHGDDPPMFRNSIDEEADHGAALLVNAHLPWWLRVLPVWLLAIGSASLVISVVLTTGWTYVSLTMGGDPLVMPPLYYYSFTGLIDQMWQSGAQASALGLAFLSAVVTFSRLIALAVLWITPDALIASEKRGHALEVLDYLGKWSAYFFLQAILIPIAFRLSVVVPDGITVQLFTMGTLALFFCLFGALVSMVASALMVYAHRRALKAAQVPAIVESLPTAALWRRPFLVGGEAAQLRPVAVVLIVLWLLASAALVGYAIAVDNISFSIVGMASELLPFLGWNDATNSYSVWWTSLHYYEVLPNITWALIFGMTAVCWCGVVMPAALLLLLGVLLLVPLSHKALAAVAALARFCRNWSFLEVMFTALVGTWLSVSLLAQFLLGTNCVAINRILVEHFGDVVPDGLCFGVEASTLPALWVLLAAALSLLGVAQVVLSLTRRCLDPTTAADSRWLRPFVLPVDKERLPLIN